MVKDQALTSHENHPIETSRQARKRRQRLAADPSSL
jgi:hypothetical protein